MAPLASSNQHVQLLRRLVGRRSARSDAGVFVVEGPVLVAEAIRSAHRIRAVYADVAVSADIESLGRDVAAMLDATGVLVCTVSAGVLGRVLSTVSPRPWCAIVESPLVDASEVIAAPGPVVACVGISDPGNLGTVVRSAEAMGAAGVLVTAGSVDPLAPKVVRASAGSVLRVPLGEVTAPDLLELAHASGRSLVGLSGASGDDLWSSDLGDRTILCVGNEAAGLPAGLELDGLIAVAMVGEVESLNAAVATSIVLAELARRRRTSPTH